MLFNNFKTHTTQNLSFLNNSKLLIAISGGIDSVVLAHLCSNLDLDFALAHCNFNLRGKESDADEDFVLKLSEDLKVETFIQRFDTEAYANENKSSIQMAARELRYEWFNDLAQQLDFDYILTAHHADDNLETFLINFTRGTGINGLTGIPLINGNIVRPLLPFSRAQIEAYAKTENIQWREDSSNASDKYLRNKLRHQVIPVLKEINPQLLTSFKNTLENLNDTTDIIEESLDAVLKRAITDMDNNGISFKAIQFKKLNNPKAYLYEMFKDYGFTEWNDVVNLLDAETGKYVTSNTHKLTKHRELIILSDLIDKSNKKENVTLSLSKHQIESSDALFETPIGNLSFKEVSNSSEVTKNTIFIDKEKLKFPVKLRLWQKEDMFYPSGMKGKKKVSKYLKDEKLKPSEKQNTWVLTSENKIIWIIGKRADQRFKVSNNTKQMLKIQIE